MEENVSIYLEKLADCKYGENAWQNPAGIFTYKNDYLLAVDKFKLIAGTDLSYNNWCDIKRMVHTITHISAGMDVNFGTVPKISLAVKHGNVCGASFSASEDNSENECLIKTIEGDTRAIFGGSVMANFNITGELAEILMSHHMANANGAKRLLDVIVAPGFDEDAIEILARKHGKCRLVINPNLANLSKDSIDKNPIYNPVPGGFLKQPNYTFVLDFKDERISLNKTDAIENENIQKDILLAWAVGSTGNSNTVSLVREGKIVGNGVGQQDRVGACKLAISRARDAWESLHDSNATTSPLAPLHTQNNGEGNATGFILEGAEPSPLDKGGRGDFSLEGAVAYSDSFFPFNDAPEVLIDAGIKTIFSTSGSVNDQRLIDLCTQKNVNLIMLPDSVARGFFGH